MYLLARLNPIVHCPDRATVLVCEILETGFVFKVFISAASCFGTVVVNTLNVFDVITSVIHYRAIKNSNVRKIRHIARFNEERRNIPASPQDRACRSETLTWSKTPLGY